MASGSGSSWSLAGYGLRGLKGSDTTEATSHPHTRKLWEGREILTELHAAWHAAVHGVAKSRTRLSDSTADVLKMSYL